MLLHCLVSLSYEMEFLWRFERKILTDHAGLSCFLVILLTFGVYSVHYLRAPLSWLYPGEMASCIINNYNTTCSNGLRPILRSWFVPTRTAGRTGDLKLLSARGIDACVNCIDSLGEKLIPVLSPRSLRAEHRYSPCQLQMALHWSGSRARLDSAALSLTSWHSLAPGHKVGSYLAVC